MEREVHLDRLHIDFRHEGDFAEVALTFAILVLQDVALALFTAQHFTRRSDFESFGDSFSRLGDASIFGHRGADARREPLRGKVFFTAGSGADGSH